MSYLMEFLCCLALAQLFQFKVFSDQKIMIRPPLDQECLVSPQEKAPKHDCSWV